MTDISWPAVVSAVLLALIAGLPGMIAAWKANTVKGMVTDRSDSQDHQLNKIEQATNGGVQALRNEVNSLKALLATAVEELRTERAKP